MDWDSCFVFLEESMDGLESLLFFCGEKHGWSGGFLFFSVEKNMEEFAIF